MAVTLKVKTKTAPKSATVAVVDRIVELKKAIDAIAPLQKEFKKLTDDLRAQAMEQDPAHPVVFDGTDHSVLFTEAAKVRKLTDMQAVRKALGNDIFFEVAKVTLTDIDKYLSPEESAQLCTVESGPRKIDIVEK
jgi:glutamate-1-semialdehyde aminotransferase